MYIATITTAIFDEPITVCCPRCGERVPRLRVYRHAFEELRSGEACHRCVRAIEQETEMFWRVACKHGVRGEGYDILAEFDFCCAGCKSIGPLQLDHDHAHCPGKHGCRRCVRAYLCVGCNGKLRATGDNPVALRASGHPRDLALARYVENFRASPREAWVA